MIKMSRETEALIEAKATRTGRTPDEIVRAALTRRRRVALAQLRKAPVGSPDKRRADCQHGRNRPTADPRSIDEIIGYDDFGLPR